MLFPNHIYCGLFLLLVSTVPALGQTVPTAQTEKSLLTGIRWQRERLAPGVTYQHAHPESLFGVRQSLHVIEIDLNRAPVKVQVAYRDTALLPTSQLAASAGAIAAVNGNFFHTEEGGSVCFLKVDGKILDTSRTDLTERLFLDQLDDAALIISSNGLPDILTCPVAGWGSLREISTILSAGPLLVYKGSLVRQSPHSFNDSRYARTGAGLTADNHLLLVTVDGNTEGAAGMTIAEFGRLFTFLDCHRALNLDGGGSATLWIKGKPGNGVASYPSDNKRYDHGGERKVANAVVVTFK